MDYSGQIPIIEEEGRIDLPEADMQDFRQQAPPEHQVENFDVHCRQQNCFSS